MSVVCGFECFLCLGFTRWLWKRLRYVGSNDSDSWPLAAGEDFHPIPRICRTVLAAYEEDISHPHYAPPAGYGMKLEWLIKRVSYKETESQCPPYLIYADREHNEIILAIRGLNLVRNSDYKVLLNNHLGMQMFDGGYVHHGLLKAATFVLNRESEMLRQLIREGGPDYKMVFAGHSLGSGVAALMTVIVVNHRDQFGGIPRNQIRCYAIAPARCMSLNLAVKYADVINSIILQDDFLPRTPTPLEHIFGSIFCLPCLLIFHCLRDTVIPESRKLRDPRRLYAPGRMYHIVERKVLRWGRFPPEVRTAIPVEGRFEHIVLSCNSTSDHSIVWIEREAQKILDMMKESDEIATSPAQQKMERKQTSEKEHRDALKRAVTLRVPHAASPSELKPDVISSALSENNNKKVHTERDSKSGGKTNWDDLVDRLFIRNEPGSSLFLKTDICVI